MQIKLYRLSFISLVCIFLVIIAGSIVRMTGSGMGCPDWPKCFGYYIPPTSIETLTWREGREFDKGNIIVENERLLVAKSDFVSGESFNPENWEPYLKHDYALFNPTHTWVEFINRLIGAVTGLPVLLAFLVSVFYFKRDPLVTVIAFLGLVLLGFEAWLGKVVVDGNLVPHQITYHMFGAVALVGLYTFLVIRLKPQTFSFQKIRDKKVLILGWFAVLLLLFQIFLGTSVREEIDAIGKSILLGFPDWIEELTVVFKVHRTFSLAVLFIIGVFALRIINTRTVSTLPRILLVTIVLEILAGMGLAYLKLPAALQPVHLFLAILDFSLLLAIIFQYRQKTAATV